ncbi:hypothetical protein ABID42_003744 [Arcicella rosea]|uniref:hypothetical protein n=1 Tax=Arcicella rosea TaxID=502909 RepID=UPI00345D8980
MKTLEKLKAIFLRIDNAKSNSEIEALSLEVDKLLNERPIEGIADFLLEQANLLNQKIKSISTEFEVNVVQ